MKNHRKLRCGYTTGSCAAGAAKAAAIMLLSGNEVHQVSLMTPKGILLNLEVLEIRMTDHSVRCAIRKDGGDDPDVTNGILVYAEVSLTEKACIVDGGEGVGRVTRKGLKQQVGEAAINPVPRKMITDELMQVCDDFEYRGGIRAVISIPEGVEIAAKTFNPRLGIEGGISVLGTSGIVIPMSEDALIESIRLEMQMLKAGGHDYILITPGNYGETFTKEETDLDLSASMKCSNYVGETLDMAAEMGIKGVLFVAHIGKFIKVAGGIMNTHSRQSDARAELMAAFALRAGADSHTACEILDTVTTEEALDVMEAHGIRRRAMELAAEKIRQYLQHRVAGEVAAEAIIFSNQYGYLAQTSGAEELSRHFSKTH